MGGGVWGGWGLGGVVRGVGEGGRGGEGRGRGEEEQEGEGEDTREEVGGGQTGRKGGGECEGGKKAVLSCGKEMWPLPTLLSFLSLLPVLLSDMALLSSTSCLRKTAALHLTGAGLASFRLGLELGLG